LCDELAGTDKVLVGWWDDEPLLCFHLALKGCGQQIWWQCM